MIRAGNKKYYTKEQDVAIHKSMYVYQDFPRLFDYGFSLIANIDNGTLLEIYDMETYDKCTKISTFDPLYLRLYYGKDKEFCILLEYINTNKEDVKFYLIPDNPSYTIPDLLYFRGSISLHMKNYLNRVIA